MKTTEKKAIAQILKMNATIAKIDNQMEDEYGSQWFERKSRNEKRNERIKDIYNKMEKYTALVTE